MLKRIVTCYLILTVVFAAGISRAQVPVPVGKIPDDDKHKVFTTVDHMPEFSGGKARLREYLEAHTNYPKTAIHDTAQGEVIVSFLINKKGKIKDPVVRKSVRKDLDKAALSVVKKMPKWKPGMNKGKPVNVFFVLPIKFVWEENLKKKKKATAIEENPSIVPDEK